jgi:hypothetical protein
MRDTGRADPDRRTLDTHRTPDVDGWTLDRPTLTEDTDRATRHGGRPDILDSTTPLGRQSVLLWAARAALGNHDGSA